MTETEIYDNLCIRDKRNPYHKETFSGFKENEIPLPRKECLCYNCLPGIDQCSRDWLALEILRLHKLIEG